MSRQEMMNVKEVRTLEQLEDLEPRWNALLAESETANPFLTPEWIGAWWRSFGGGDDGRVGQLRVVVVEADGKPIAIAPLMSATRSLFGVPLTVVSNIVNEHSFRAGLILTTRREEALQAIIRHVRRSCSNWNLISLRHLAREDAERVALKQALALDGGLVGEAQIWRSPYLPVTQDWETYFASVSRTTRYAVRRKVRKMARLPGFSVTRIEDPGREGLLDEIFEVDRKSWQYENASGLGSDQATRDFYSRVAERAWRRGWFRSHLLSVCGEPVAFEFNLVYKDVLYNLKLGYDSRYARYSPGLVLRYHVIQDAFRQGYREVDFLGDEDHYKVSWTSHARDHIDIHVSNPSSLKGLAFHGYHFKLKKVLKRIGPLQALVHGIRADSSGSNARKKDRAARPNESSHRKAAGGDTDPMTGDSRP